MSIFRVELEKGFKKHYRLTYSLVRSDNDMVIKENFNLSCVGKNESKFLNSSVFTCVVFFQVKLFSLDELRPLRDVIN